MRKNLSTTSDRIRGRKCLWNKNFLFPLEYAASRREGHQPARGVVLRPGPRVVHALAVAQPRSGQKVRERRVGIRHQPDDVVDDRHHRTYISRSSGCPVDASTNAPLAEPSRGDTTYR